MTSTCSAADTAHRRLAEATARPDLFALDHALYDATTMASLTVEFVGRALGIDDGQTRLNEEDTALLAFAVLQTKIMTEKARALFQGLEVRS